MLQPLLANLAVSALVLVAWISAGDRLDRISPRLRNFLFGVAMAIGTVSSMMFAYQVAPGVFFDLRGPIIAVSAYFGGPVVALVTATAATVYRVSLGGAITVGIAVIVVAAVVGLAMHRLHRPRSSRGAGLLLMSLTIVAANLVIALVMPDLNQAAITKELGTSLLALLVSTLGLGAVLMREEHRRALARSNQLYRAMVDSLPDCLNIKDAEGVFLAANPATARLMQAGSVDALIGKTDFDFYPADLAERFRADEVEVLKTGNSATIEQAGQRADGSPGWLSTLKAPVTLDGQKAALVTHNRDITAKKALELELEEAQAHLDLAIGNMNDGLALYDPEGRVAFCNDRYRAMFPITAHMRHAGVAFADIMRASIALGEEKLPSGMSADDHVAAKVAGLKREGEEHINLEDGRSFLARTKILDNGSTLRMMSDVTERHRFERDLKHQALHDPLTGLPNRAYFNQELDRLLGRAMVDGSDLAVMLVDLDRFKRVNDTLGHAAGDALLIEVSNRLRAAMRTGDFVARIGGDEFAVLMPCRNIGDGHIGMATRLVKSLAKPMTFGEARLMPGGTIGYTIFPHDRSNADELLLNADRALYRAKAKDRGTWACYDVRIDGLTKHNGTAGAALAS